MSKRLKIEVIQSIQMEMTCLLTEQTIRRGTLRSIRNHKTQRRKNHLYRKTAKKFDQNENRIQNRQNR